MARTVLDRSEAARALAGVFRKRGFDGGFPVGRPAGNRHRSRRKLSEDEQQFNLVHAHVRTRAEQGNAWLKNYRALQKVTLCPWRIGVIAAAVLVLLHLQHDRTA